MKKFIFAGLMALSFSLFADPAAVVLFVSDKVTAEHNGASRNLTRGSSLVPGDSITTSSGYANIKYTNGTIVNLGPKTNYKILAYTPKPGAVQIKAQLNYGAMNSKTGGNTKEVLKTPEVALAILGTSYEVSVSGGKVKGLKLHKHGHKAR